MLKIIILGCGASQGVPVIGCKCEICKSDSRYNKRQRSAIVIEYCNIRILYDFGPDIKNQLIEHGIEKVDFAILSHDHSDHSAGIDDLRVLAQISKKPLPIYSTIEVIEAISAKYQYLVDMGAISLNVVDAPGQISLDRFNIMLFRQSHGKIQSLGIRVENFVYSPDVNDFPVESLQYLENLDTWLVDCMSYHANHAHAGLDTILKWKEQFRPNKIYLTNMRHDLEYHALKNDLDASIEPCYDGLIFNVKN